ncbi:unnamed protein product [Lactuca virosa]|uniref:Uncharacterized protein n=1 Tax=Lactuca virosa TaxID=75947 RepID=A0AAU9NUQ8_9ASTR|nr:unnamed protein product [Lactuca virosa]
MKSKERTSGVFHSIVTMIKSRVGGGRSWSGCHWAKWQGSARVGDVDLVTTMLSGCGSGGGGALSVLLEAKTGSNLPPYVVIH